MAEAFDKYDISGRKILIPRAEVAREFLPTALRDAGASVDVVSVYRSVIPDESRTIAAGLWNAGDAPNWVTVTSSSTVTNLAQLVPIDQLKNSRFASIGPITSRTTRELGLEVAVEPSSYTTEGLIAALVSHLDGE